MRSWWENEREGRRIYKSKSNRKKEEDEYRTIK